MFLANWRLYPRLSKLGFSLLSDPRVFLFLRTACDIFLYLSFTTFQLITGHYGVMVNSADLP
jgi:hypothetical protein